MRLYEFKVIAGGFRQFLDDHAALCEMGSQFLKYVFSIGMSALGSGGSLSRRTVCGFSQESLQLK